MLSQRVINDIAIKWQTSEFNVVREYFQHIFLSSLYQMSESDGLAFKGGTALRIAFGSPRFSEDLDFSSNITSYHLKSLFNQVILSVRKNGLNIIVEENKPTSGGFLAIYRAKIHECDTTISLNASTRSKAANEAILISSPFASPYQCLILKTEDLVAEKVQAALTRKKPRDFFDIYFLLRERRGLNAIIKLRERLLQIIEKLDAKSIQKELKQFLPVSHHKIITSLPEVLKNELKRL